MITEPSKDDGPWIHRINVNVGVFTREEVECVDELWEEYRTHGSEQSGYYWLTDHDGKERVLGYTCYGPHSLTSGTFDLYWIAVDPAAGRGGIGRVLLSATEESVRKRGGRLLIVETSGLPRYENTRRFYLATGYLQEAVLKNFYSPGDDLVIFTKAL